MRLSPDRWEGTARAWLYFRDEKDYAEDAVRKSFRFLLKEAAGDQKLRRLTTLALAKEASLCAFLEGIGFESAGLLRDAVFLHGEYVPARVYVLAAENL
jgi:RimJ/RimL family protein N-acetyltransferase